MIKVVVQVITEEDILTMSMDEFSAVDIDITVGVRNC